jgi:hypothetical protein
MSELNKLIASLSGRAGPVLDPDDPVFISIQLYARRSRKGLTRQPRSWRRSFLTPRIK